MRIFNIVIGIALLAAAITAIAWFAFDYEYRNRNCQSVLVVNTWVTWCQ